MEDSVISTSYESLDSLEADHSPVTVEDDLGATGTAAYNEHRGDNSNVCLQDNKLDDVVVSDNAGGPQTVDVGRNTNSPNVTVPRNTNSPNGQEAKTNTSNSSQTSVNSAANVEQNASKQQQNPVSRNQRLYQGIAKHPEYADEPKRRGTFRNWPARLQQSPEMMSGAGFFFSLNGDSVRCFLCGIGLRNWDKDDNAWVEHARWSPKCAYVLEKKGQSFVDLVQDAVRNAELQQALRENNERHWNENNAVGYQAEQTETDRANPQSDLVTSQRPGRPDQFPSDAERKNPLLCDAAQSVLNMGYLPRVVKQCLDEFLKLEGWHSMSGKKLMKMIMDKEDVGDLDPDLYVVPAQRHPKQVLLDKMSVPKARLEQEIATMKERISCKICLQNPVAIVFLPCGHLVSCPVCAPALKKCPICRGPMKATVRVSFGS
ncbi:putative inhibitor of apoptosis [Mizuhopecten yessoensis]|uniref:putative inhibitor of apoptosis n=1 Tax=Mizuhopecten yessoensis TaxID=6573 RepID=UPI000B45C080|nr:putative inhibitor of apoptosis [Mizuhopecten yessoensis]XP_021360356.1 putative inhibitor of apoptosis [Mizuhopecten yessoensis]XP_021360357.1 putative inhibitor of apoptosis [Mizuhopecten yessoensis]XP_021360358.1 putative inhibitor of apoptosis [Mizuhopecten yessoensis]